MKRITILIISSLLFTIAVLSAIFKENVGNCILFLSTLVISCTACVLGLSTKRIHDRNLKIFVKALGTSMFFVLLSQVSLIICSIFASSISFSLANSILFISYIPVLFIIFQQIVNDFKNLYEQILMTIFIGLLLSVQYLDFFVQIVNNFSQIISNNHLIKFDLFILLVFLVFDFIFFILLLILFAIYSKRSQNYWGILIISYLMLTVSDYYFFKYLIFQREIFLQIYRGFNLLYLGTILIGIILSKQNILNFKTVSDIIQERQQYRLLYEELDRVNKQLVTFTNVMKQDLRNDLAVIETAMEMFSESNDSMFKEMIIDRIKKMREKIFNIGAVEGFLVDDKIKPISLKVLQAAAVAFENVCVYGLDKEIFVKANKFLFSVFYGLISNAVHHAGENAKVWIEVEEKENHVFVHVKDNGIGIPSKEKKEIFHRDYKKRLYKGGMNLFLIKITLDTFGGEIFLQDNYPSGSDFIVKLEKLYTDAF
ncbi:MAG: sensor histidine kinase [Candidatus Heimdallarchaeaceae archaeon]